MTNQEQVRSLYNAWIESWNQQDADKMVALLTEDCTMVGFDGSQMNGREDIRTTIGSIFSHHPTARFVSIVREVRFLAPTVAVLRAVAGMVPRRKAELNPETNAIQTLIAVAQQGQWLMAVFQNTPAAFHGRPGASEKLTEELRQRVSEIGNWE